MMNGTAVHQEEAAAPAESVVEVKSDVTIRPVQSALVPDVWPYVEDILDRAIEAGNGDRLASDYLELLCYAKAQLWLVMVERKLTAAVLTEVRIGPRRKTCTVELMAGADLERWFPEADRTITRWAREIGCTAIDCPVRPGLVPFLRKAGFKETHRLTRRRIDN
jgi:hypothetical protein